MAGRQKARRGNEATGAGSLAAIEKYQPALYRFLMRRLRGVEDVQDLVQDAYLRFLQVPHAELIRQPQAYLYRIAANLVSEFSLRRKRGQVVYDSHIAHEWAEHPREIGNDELGEHLSHAQEVERLERVLEQLPKAYQAVLILRVRDGLSRDEIARQLNLAPQTVKKYLFRAIAHCRAAHWEP